MNKLFLAILVMVWSLNAAASTDRVYMSPMEKSRWILSQNSVLRCEITHQIPRFGTAVFYQESGRNLRLKIESHHRFKKNLDIYFRSVSANWKGFNTQADLARLKSSGANPLVRITDNAARHAYFELQQGYQPSLYFNDEEDGFNVVSVILSTVNFRDVEADFGECLTRLYPDHFDDVKTARVHFDFDEEFPTLVEEERSLSKLLNYLQVDQTVKTISVVGHTDFKGTVCYNETLSARRAWYIYDYLVQNGIEPSRLRMTFKGESDPLVKGKDDRSRAKNRRVEVTLHR